MSEHKAPYNAGVTSDDELVARIAFSLAREVRKFEDRARETARQEEDDFWRQFLKNEGLAHIYRKAITARGMMYISEEDIEGGDAIAGHR